MRQVIVSKGIATIRRPILMRRECDVYMRVVRWLRLAASELEVDEGLNHIVFELDDDLQSDQGPYNPGESGQDLEFLEESFFEVWRKKCYHSGYAEKDSHFLSGQPKSCEVFPLGVKCNLFYASKC